MEDKIQEIFDKINAIGLNGQNEYELFLSDEFKILLKNTCIDFAIELGREWMFDCKKQGWYNMFSSVGNPIPYSTTEQLFKSFVNCKELSEINIDLQGKRLLERIDEMTLPSDMVQEIKHLVSIKKDYDEFQDKISKYYDKKGDLCDIGNTTLLHFGLL